jgi:DNA-binding MarR family transcriptional regulator
VRHERHTHARSASPRATGGYNAEVVTAQDVDWLVVYLRAVVAASAVVWAGRGMTLLQLTALHLINALAPVTLTDLAQALGTRPPATSAMVDRLARAGLVRRTPDPQDHRRVQLTVTTDAQPIVGDADPDTATRLQAVLNGISPQTRRHVIDVLIDTVRRSAK